MKIKTNNHEDSEVGEMIGSAENPIVLQIQDGFDTSVTPPAGRYVPVHTGSCRVE